MPKNLVIVESPAKAKTIEKFLGKDYKVMSSYGHIRDLQKKDFSVDIEHGYKPIYEIPDDKKELVKQLKSEASKADTVWLASDEDREGEAIAWHLYEVLKLSPEKTKRIVFHEITKNAILHAIDNPRSIDIDRVNAQQARRVLDRIVGFELSPVLWKKIKPALSAGRVQSVAVRLIVEREKEIKNFKAEEYYRVVALLSTTADGQPIRAELSRRLDSKEEAMALLESCKDATFKVADLTVKPLSKSPAAPFTTSTLQQEASRKLGFTVAQTMMVAQRLYESGYITYMRTDSVNLSSLALSTIKEEINKSLGEKYYKRRNYHTTSKGAQEAHEAIRPTYISNREIDGTAQERRLYDLIWKRTIATQMADAEIEKTTVEISISNRKEVFVATGEVIKFDGFLHVYMESTDDDVEEGNEEMRLPSLKVGEQLTMTKTEATQRYTQQPPRYSEAMLVRKLEELGIGRPSTYAPTISTIQQREYVHKGDKKGEERQLSSIVLKGKQVTEKTRTEITGNDKGKLMPTDIGIVVNDFLLQYFPGIMDYNFTAKVEQKFDEIAEGNEKWTDMMREFYNDFEPVVEKTMNIRAEHKAGERQLGVEPKSGKPVYVKIGRFGPVVQIGDAEDKDKPKFAQLPSKFSMESITLEEAMELFKLPRELGKYEGKNVTVGAGRFGPYILHDKKYVSVPKDMDALTITLQDAIALIDGKRLQEQQRHIKCFSEDPKMEVLNGRYGPYIQYDGTNYRLPKNLHDKAAELTYEECKQIVDSTPVKKK